MIGLLFLSIRLLFSRKLMALAVIGLFLASWDAKAGDSLLDFGGAKLENVWNKEALKGELLTNGVRIKARSGKLFDDASLWTVRFPKPILLKSGRVLVMTIATGSKHKPLWQNLLLSLLVNGKPGQAVAVDGIAKATLAKAENGMRYVTSKDLPMKLAIIVPGTALSSISVTTAGADGLNITLDDMKLSSKTPSVVAKTVPNVQLSDHDLRAAAQEAWGAFASFSASPTFGPYDLVDDPAKRAIVFDDQKTVIDVSGGWFDAGDYGRYVSNTAHSVTLLALTGLLAPDVMPETIQPLAAEDTDKHDWKDLLRPALDWLLTMQRPDGGVYHKVTSADFAAMSDKPETDRAARFIMPITSTATAHFATTMELGALLLNKADYIAAADKAHRWLAQNPRLTMIPSRFGKHSYGGHYGDDDDQDERFMAKAARLLQMSESKLSTKSVAAAVERLAKAGDDAGWKNNDLFALWIAHALGDKNAQKALTGLSQRWLAAQARSPLNIMHRAGDPVHWGFNGRLALRSWHMALTGRLFERADFSQSAKAQMGWFFGANPNDQIMMTGPGDKFIKHPHFRPHTSGAVALPTGLLVGGPNGEDGAGDPVLAALSHMPPLARHKDDAASYATNEVAINWQAAFATALSLTGAPPTITGAVPLP